MPLTDPTAPAALDQLAAALEAMDPRTRIQLATETLRAGGTASEHPPEARAFWLAIHDLTNGATPERLEHLVSVLEVIRADVRRAIAHVARQAAQAAQQDPPRANVWQALATVADGPPGARPRR